ncbi:MAG: MFS transporter [Pseudomonadota bacterium]
MTGSAELGLGRRTRLAGMIGNALEWYDFAIYGYFAATIGQHFFPGDDPAVSLVASFGVFAIGFLARPVGSIVFGNLGDRVGRRQVLVISVFVMAVPTALIGLLPTYETIGVAAPILLIVLRLLQGLSVGGEMTGSITFMVENAPRDKRGRAGSWSYFGVGGGFLLGSAAGSLVTGLLTAEDVASWGWRVPFLCGVLIGVCGYVIRRKGLAEQFRPSETKEPWYRGPLREAVTVHTRQMFQAIGVAAFFAGGFYLIFVYLTSYVTEVVGESSSDALTINSINMVIFAILSIVGGVTGDRFGFRRVLLVTAIAGFVLALPLFWLVDHAEPTLVFLGQLGFVIILAPHGGLFATTMALLFPPNVRMSGFSVSYNLAFALLGGTAPLAASYLISRQHGDLSPAYVLMVCAAISIATIVWAWRDLPGQEADGNRA